MQSFVLDALISKNTGSKSMVSFLREVYTDIQNGMVRMMSDVWGKLLACDALSVISPYKILT